MAETRDEPKAKTLSIAMLRHEPIQDARVCLTPSDVAKLTQAGHTIRVPAAPSSDPAFSADAYSNAGALVTASDDELLEATILVTLHPPAPETAGKLTPNHTLLGFLSPFERAEAIAELADRGTTAVALELVPRTTIAQSMDALSSQASLAGYAAVMLAAARLPKAFPMMSTAAGTIRPAKVLVLGAGVAGLQAIATAQRLGARVTGFDVRSAAAEQVRSLGAKFAPVPNAEAEDAETAGGYAKEASDDQLARQREHLKALAATSDIVITTAQVFAKAAPTLMTLDMIDAMQPGSVIIDAAAATGGNVERTEGDSAEERTRNGVTIIADPILPARVAHDASQVLSANIVALLDRITNPQTATIKQAGEDDIADAVTVTRSGSITDGRIAARTGTRNEGASS
ncbi:MAG: NAD(P) transhydrogenase subunit alpha [Planctomycetota bacterium]